MDEPWTNLARAGIRDDSESSDSLVLSFQFPFEKSRSKLKFTLWGCRLFYNQRWGTRQPITLRDNDFGIIRLKGFGKFAYRVTDPSLLLNTVVGTQGKLTTQEILDYLRDNFVTGLTVFLRTPTCRCWPCQAISMSSRR